MNTIFQQSIFRSLILLLCVFISCSFASSVNLQSAQQLLKQGNYSEAIDAFKRLLESNSKDAEAQRGLLQAYIETGKYEEAEKSALQFLSNAPDESAIRNLLGEVYFITGKYSEAEKEFERAAQQAQGKAVLRPKLNKAILLVETGRETQAQEIFQSFIDYYNRSSAIGAEELTLIARAVTYLEKYHDANRLYLDAIDADKSYIEAHLGGGELFVEKYNYGEAGSFFDDALKINPTCARAHLGIARTKEIDGGPQAMQAAIKALQINPNLVEGRSFLAAQYLEADQFDRASAEIEKALKVNPNSLPARSLKAVFFYLSNRDKEFQDEVARALSINPRYGELYHTLARFSVNRRLYQQAVDFARKAIELQPRLWKAYSTLGINLLRIGNEAEGRRALEKAFEGDPFNVWTKNTLDLLDSMRDYKEVSSEHFRIKIAAKEVDALAPYATAIAEDAYQKLSEKYRFRPQGPILINMFPNHEDFAVATLGLPGLGALGVCFGKVIAMDSPSARELGRRNWGSTLWHEFMHVISLQATDHKIPRWFSEGLSVYEERRARPGWGDDWTIESLKAFLGGEFLGIDEIDNGFMRPTTPGQVQVSYFQASLICEFIEHNYGFDTIVSMLKLYKENLKTAEILDKLLKLSPAQFDKAFKDYVSSNVASYQKAIEFQLLEQEEGGVSKERLLEQIGRNPDSFVAHLRLGALYRKEGDREKAIEHLKRAADLFPYYTRRSNPHSQLADIYLEQGKNNEAISALERLINIDEDAYEEHKKLAQLLIGSGDGARARQILERAMYINPFDLELHNTAGEFYLSQNDYGRALREFQVAMALKPADMASAHYNLARAYLAKGEKALAKKEVLRSLEVAPGFEKAQELLLKVSRN